MAGIVKIDRVNARSNFSPRTDVSSLSLREILQYLATGEEALFFAIIDNPTEIVNRITPLWVKMNLVGADDQDVARLFHILQDLKDQPKIESSVLFELIEDRGFQNWKTASEALFSDRAGDAKFDHGAVGERLQRNDLIDRAKYWAKLEG